MQGEVLTGRDAIEAVGLWARLGNADARFDGRRVAAALRSRAGRLRVAAALAKARAAVVAVDRPEAAAPRETRTRRRRRRRVSRVLAASSARPRLGGSDA